MSRTPGVTSRCAPSSRMEDLPYETNRISPGPHTQPNRRFCSIRLTARSPDDPCRVVDIRPDDYSKSAVLDREDSLCLYEICTPEATVPSGNQICFEIVLHKELNRFPNTAFRYGRFSKQPFLRSDYSISSKLRDLSESIRLPPFTACSVRQSWTKQNRSLCCCVRSCRCSYNACRISVRETSFRTWSHWRGPILLGRCATWQPTWALSMSFGTRPSKGDSRL